MTTVAEVYGLGLAGDRVWLEGSRTTELPVRDWTSGTNRWRGRRRAGESGRYARGHRCPGGRAGRFRQG